MEEENPVIGKYKDGSDIHQHPSEREISDHIDEWYELWIQTANEEQREIMEELRNNVIYNKFKDYCTRKKLNDYDVMVTAIKWWADQWPWKVKEFTLYANNIKKNLFDEKGYAASDTQRSMVLYGSMPDDIKGMISNYRRDFFRRDKNGRSKNLNQFYNMFDLGKFSTYKNSA